MRTASRQTKPEPTCTHRPSPLLPSSPPRQVLGREHQRYVASVPPSRPRPHAPILFGKHAKKMAYVADSGVECRSVTDLSAPDGSRYMGAFDVVVDATGSPQGLSLASSLCRPMGPLVLKVKRQEEWGWAWGGGGQGEVVC